MNLLKFDRDTQTTPNRLNDMNKASTRFEYLRSLNVLTSSEQLELKRLAEYLGIVL